MLHLKRFKAKTLKHEPGDQSFSSMEELIAGLDRKPHGKSSVKRRFLKQK